MKDCNCGFELARLRGVEQGLKLSSDEIEMLDHKIAKLEERNGELQYLLNHINSFVMPGEVDSIDSLRALFKNLDKADAIILDIHAQITTYSKYTASKVYEWKDIRGKAGTDALKVFDDNGRDE